MYPHTTTITKLFIMAFVLQVSITITMKFSSYAIFDAEVCFYYTALASLKVYVKSANNESIITLYMYICQYVDLNIPNTCVASNQIVSTVQNEYITEINTLTHIAEMRTHFTEKNTILCLCYVYTRMALHYGICASTVLIKFQMLHVLLGGLYD